MRSWIVAVLSWTVILAVAAVLLAAVLVPRLGGATPYTVLTSSMSPGLPPGTLVVIRPVPVEDIAVGSVITYQLESGKPTVVTHRVVGAAVDLRGERRFVTQGDANTVSDELAVMPVQIKGELWYAVPYLGQVNNILTGRERQVVVYVVAALLLGYAAFMGTSAARDRLRPVRRHRAPDKAEAS